MDTIWEEMTTMKFVEEDFKIRVICMIGTMKEAIESEEFDKPKALWTKDEMAKHNDDLKSHDPAVRANPFVPKIPPCDDMPEFQKGLRGVLQVREAVQLSPAGSLRRPVAVPYEAPDEVRSDR